MEIDVVAHDPAKKKLWRRKCLPLIKDEDQIQSQFISEQMHLKLMELEGQCKIKYVLYLRINYLKAIILAILMTISVVGLLLLKYYPKIRAFVFYSQVVLSRIDEATHIYIIDMAVLIFLVDVMDDTNKASDLFFVLQLVYIVVVILKGKHFLFGNSNFFCLLKSIIFVLKVCKSVICNHGLYANLSNIVLQVRIYLFLQNYRLGYLLSQVFHIDLARRQLYHFM